MRTLTKAFVLILSSSVISACGGGGVAPAPNAPAILPPSSGTGAGTKASQPPPSSVHISEIATPVAPSDGITIGSDGAVYLVGASEFMRYMTGFSQFPIPPVPGTPPAPLVANSIANGPSGTVWTTVQGPLPGGAESADYYGSATLSIATGNVTENVNGGDRLDVYEDIATGPSLSVWAVHTANGVPPPFAVVILTPTTGFEVPPIGNPSDGRSLGPLAEGGDGMMYIFGGHFALDSTPVIYRFNPVTGAVLNTIPVNNASSIAQFTAGPDGAVWFTDSVLNKIGRVTSGGSVSYYNIPTPNAGLDGITPGSDNALWFTETTANKIGRISTTGSVTEYAVPTAGARPQGITAGAPGACIPQTIYFTEANAIGKLTFSP